ncbi:MAG TPA: class I SAM-dependent methyltransferase [Roseiarcus sp.]|jgi:methyltransferase (TIGR00027 family)|nr:class I SAM-dependent methyltransferase [Roseiarcus sp.]
MQGHASLTAKGAATHRAVHQLLEGGEIFSDPLAVAILGEDPEAILREAQENPERRILRLFIAARSRFAEERLAAAVAHGVRQLVVLGAGLDTFGLRNPHREKGLNVFEVDHPATQAWKRERIEAAAPSKPQSLCFVSVDFERQSFFEELAKAGFDRQAPTFVMWLGVVPYLTREAIIATLAALACASAEVVFNYGEPLEAFSGARRAYMEAFHARVAALGEPFLSRFRPAEMAALLGEAGFRRLEDFGPHEMAVYLGAAAPPAPGTPGGHVVYASSG